MSAPSRKGNASGSDSVPVFAASIALALVLISGNAMAAELRVLAVVVYKTSMPALASAFERRTGHRVDAVVMAPIPLMETFRQDRTFDVVMTIQPTVEQFVAQGLARADTRRTVARSGIGVAVPQGAARPAIGTADELAATFASARTIAFSGGPSGVYVESLLARMKIEDAGGTRFVRARTEPVAAVLRRREADIGLQQMSELLGQPGVDVVGPLPAEVQHLTIVDAALNPVARSPDVADAFVAFLSSPEALAIVRRAGFDGP